MEKVAQPGARIETVIVLVEHDSFSIIFPLSMHPDPPPPPSAFAHCACRPEMETGQRWAPGAARPTADQIIAVIPWEVLFGSKFDRTVTGGAGCWDRSGAEFDTGDRILCRRAEVQWITYCWFVRELGMFKKFYTNSI